MREDWNARAREDAGYYVAFGRRESDDAAFFATATEVINRLEWELRRVPLAERGGLARTRNRMRTGPADASHEPPFRRDPRRRRIG